VPPTSTVEAGVDSTSNHRTVFVSARLGEPESLDPARNDDDVRGREIIQNVYETLVTYDGAATDTFVPLLAESWEVSEDGKVWTFLIRPGIKFHDGADLTPSDVAYSFQRGLLSGGTTSPQWLLAEPFFGRGTDDISLLIDPDGKLYDNQVRLATADPAKLKSACEKVTSAIIADDVVGTVTITLAQPWGPFLPTIAQTWGSILDRDWTAANGGWDGSCDSWQKFYALPSDNNPLTSIMNGTGPFMLEHWIEGEEILLVRNEDYWREPARLEQIAIKRVDEWETRLAMLQSGEADEMDIATAEHRSQVDEMVGERCEFDLAANRFKRCAVIDAGKPIRRYTGQPMLASNDLFFTFDIAETSNYIGSGKLDGNGIPPDFFADIHIRRAFAYSFDWDVYIRDAFDDEAMQQPVVARPGMPGYERDAPVYSFDLLKAEEEFKLADLDNDRIPAGEDPRGDIWTTGFRLQAVYDQGNTSHQRISEILSTNLARVNELFIVESVGLSRERYENAIESSQAPYFVSGWVQDIHDPHNWYVPYLAGAPASHQRLPDDLNEQFPELIEQGLAEIDPAQRQVAYEQLNQMIYDEVPFLLLAVAAEHRYEQRWVQGTIRNPVLPGRYYYPVFKE
jgi:peptide/nickel transport system substrate-binding protein